MLDEHLFDVKYGPGASSSTISERDGARRRSVGLPGLRIQTPRCRSTCGTCVWPYTTASQPANHDVSRSSLPARGPGMWTSPIRPPSTSTTRRSGSDACRAGSSMFPKTASTGA